MQLFERMPLGMISTVMPDPSRMVEPLPTLYSIYGDASRIQRTALEAGSIEAFGYQCRVAADPGAPRAGTRDKALAWCRLSKVLARPGDAQQEWFQQDYAAALAIRDPDLLEYGDREEQLLRIQLIEKNRLDLSDLSISGKPAQIASFPKTKSQPCTLGDYWTYKSGNNTYTMKITETREINNETWCLEEIVGLESSVKNWFTNRKTGVYQLIEENGEFNEERLLYPYPILSTEMRLPEANVKPCHSEVSVAGGIFDCVVYSRWCKSYQQCGVEKTWVSPGVGIVKILFQFNVDEEIVEQVLLD